MPSWDLFWSSLATMLWRSRGAQGGTCRVQLAADWPLQAGGGGGEPASFTTDQLHATKDCAHHTSNQLLMEPLMPKPELQEGGDGGGCHWHPADGTCLLRPVWWVGCLRVCHAELLPLLPCGAEVGLRCRACAAALQCKTAACGRGACSAAGRHASPGCTGAAVGLLQPGRTLL